MLIVMTNVDVLILPDFEEGHFLPTLKLAQELKAAGYRVAYLGIADIIKKVLAVGFEGYVLFEDIYPEGFIADFKARRMQNFAVKEIHYQRLLQGEMDSLISRVSPRLLVVNSTLPVDALILHYRYEVPQIIFHSSLTELAKMREFPELGLGHYLAQSCLFHIMGLRGDFPNSLFKFLLEKGLAIQQIDDFASPVRSMPQFMPCPADLMINHRVEGRHPEDIYLGPCIREVEDIEQQEFAKFLPSDPAKKIIFLSMGSQVRVYPDRAKNIFQNMIECMSDERLRNYHLVLAGGGFSVADFSLVPSNVGIFDWVPQVELLKEATLAIIHGGLGSVKECIYFGVPMIVIPMGRDQFDNGHRVEYHHLGITCYVEELTPDLLVRSICRIQEDERIRNRMTEMQTIFEREESKQLGASFIMNFLARDCESMQVGNIYSKTKPERI